jgi:hypothetical protein
MELNVSGNQIMSAEEVELDVLCLRIGCSSLMNLLCVDVP